MERPQVVIWYRIYCAFLSLCYLFACGMGVALLVMPQLSETQDAALAGMIYIVLGAILFIPYVLGATLPARPGTWILGIVLISLSMASICCLPFNIPLLIFWLKPETKAYFGR